GREQPRDPRQDARLVVDQNAQRVPLRRLRLGREEIDRSGRLKVCVHQTSSRPLASITSPTSPLKSGRIISLCGLPEGIMGRQFSCFSTRQSNSTGFLTSSISLIASSRSAALSQLMPYPP